METARVKARQECLEREMKRRLQAKMAGGLQHFAREVGPIAEQEDDELSVNSQAVHDELAMSGRGKAQVEPPLEIFPLLRAGAIQLDGANQFNNPPDQAQHRRSLTRWHPSNAGVLGALNPKP